MFSQGGWLPIPLLQSLGRGEEEACSTCFPLKRHYLPSVPPKCRQPPTQEHASEITPVTSHDLTGSSTDGQLAVRQILPENPFRFSCGGLLTVGSIRNILQ